MEYSKRVQDLQQIYSTTPEGVLFAMLVAAGASRTEAYATIFRPANTRPTSLAKYATQLTKDNPGINKMIEAITNVSGIVDPTRKEQKKKKKNQKIGGQFREKSEILDALVDELPSLRGKDRVDALMKIADLQQMKKEESAEEAERVVYYLPLRCKSCELYHREQRRQAARNSNTIS